jgi:hypothetical protein
MGIEPESPAAPNHQARVSHFKVLPIMHEQFTYIRSPYIVSSLGFAKCTCPRRPSQKVADIGLDNAHGIQNLSVCQCLIVGSPWLKCTLTKRPMTKHPELQNVRWQNVGDKTSLIKRPCYIKSHDKSSRATKRLWYQNILRQSVQVYEISRTSKRL